MSRRIAVIGGGIIGASIGYNLARSGADVTLVHGGPDGGDATPASFAWINASQDSSRDYFNLRMRSIRLWSEMATEIKDLQPNFTGSVAWETSAQEQQQYVAQMAEWGYRVSLIDQNAIRKREPALSMVPGSAILCEHDGAIDPVPAVAGFIRAMRAHGGSVLAETCTGLDAIGGRVRAVQTATRKLPVDAVVFATGAETALLSKVGYAPPVSAPAGLMIYTQPVKPLLQGLVLTNKVHMRQTATGAIVAGSDYGGAKVGRHAGKTAMDVLHNVLELLPDAGLELASFIVGYRPTPKDGFPIVGHIRDTDNAYVAITHSGVTLAPAIGIMAADEILLDERDPLLDPYSPDRYC